VAAPKFSLISCGLIGLLGLWTLYRLRMRQIAEHLRVRFEERLAERNRVARELHDTLLQTVEGSKLVADHALKDPKDHARMVQAMERLSSWLGEATEQGLAALNSLRTSATQTNDLSDALGRAIEECRMESSMQGSVSVAGEATDLNPVVRDEVYRVGYEAIRNACTHSRGTKLQVNLSYGQDLTLRVTDNGVGIGPTVAERGKDGYFCLQGMRQRASRIGAKLILNSSSSGTEVTLVVPGRVIFRKAKKSDL
jgi:signal transduction histidine kinase